MKTRLHFESLENRNLLSADLGSNVDLSPGDANRDGLFDQTDLLSVLQSGKYLSHETASWEEGDWNRDGYFDTADLTLAYQKGCYGVFDCAMRNDLTATGSGRSPSALAAQGGGNGNIVVANRASGTISVIDTGTAQVDDFPLPAGANAPEPMYVVNTPASNHVWVGDRANDRVVVFDGNDFTVETILPAGDGVFHMWADQAGKQLWVINDVEKSVTVIDAKALQVITTIPMPADLSTGITKPHDVVLDPQGRFAYVSFLDTPDPLSDTVVKFDTATFTEVARQNVGEDPHLSFNRKNNELFIPAQGSNAVYVLDADNLSVVDIIPIAGAHGAVTSTNSKVFCTTNLPNLGVDAVTCIDTRNNTILDQEDTLATVPHNLAMTPNEKQLYVTHSGASNNAVSVFSVKGDNLSFIGEITVGFNPFGLAHVPG